MQSEMTLESLWLLEICCLLPQCMNIIFQLMMMLMLCTCGIHTSVTLHLERDKLFLGSDDILYFLFPSPGICAYMHA